MEWDFKEFASWDSTDELELELEQKEEEEDSDLAALVGSSVCISQGQSQSKGSLVVDLKLGTNLSDTTTAAGGHVNGNRPMSKLQEDPSKPSSSPSSSSASRRLNKNGSHHHHHHHKVSCLVDGCQADLSRCREYHRRHRVCELHSKTPVVTLRGEQKRFCQQCSRFHSLVEFDEVKRSCRKRLNGHNQRRRKPKPESLYFSSNFLSSFKGPRILQFSNPHLCATTKVGSMWPVEAKNGAESMLYNSHPWLHSVYRRSPPNSFNEGDKPPFLFLQTNDPKAAAGNRTAPHAFMYQQPFQTTAAESRRGVSSDGMTRVTDSGCALYLLSSHPTQNSATGLNHLVQSNVTTHPGQLLDSRLQNNGGFSKFSYSHDVEDKPINPEMMFLMGPDGFLDNGAQMLPILLE